jgi:hypothetical protein
MSVNAPTETCVTGLRRVAPEGGLGASGSTRAVATARSIVRTSREKRSRRIAAPPTIGAPSDRSASVSRQVVLSQPERHGARGAVAALGEEEQLVLAGPELRRALDPQLAIVERATGLIDDHGRDPPSLQLRVDVDRRPRGNATIGGHDGGDRAHRPGDDRIGAAGERPIAGGDVQSGVCEPRSCEGDGESE